MALEIFEKIKEKEDSINQDPVQNGPTLNAILENPKHSAMFGKMLSDENSEQTNELAIRLATHKLNSGDIELLSEHRNAFIEKLDTIKRTTAEINPSTIAKFAKGHPELLNAIGLNGEQKTANAIKTQLEYLAMNKPYEFERIASAFETIRSYKDGEYADLDESIAIKAEQYGIAEDQYVEALQIQDSTKRKEEIRKLIREKYGTFGKIKDSIFGGSKNSAEILSDKKYAIENAMDEMQEHIKHVGYVLGTTIDTNEEVREAFAMELVNQKVPAHVEEASFKEVNIKGIEMPKSEDIDAAWVEYKPTVNWDELTDQDDKDLCRNAFMKQYEDKNAMAKKTDKPGFWSSLVDIFFNSMIEDKKKVLN